jgi:hypothetical protein
MIQVVTLRIVTYVHCPLRGNGSINAFSHRHERNDWRNCYRPCFPCGLPPGLYTENVWHVWEKPSAWGYDWAILGDINTGTWPSRLDGFQIWDRKIRSRGTTRTREWLRWRGPAVIINGRPVLSSESAPNINKPTTVWLIEIWSWAPDGCLTPRQTGRLAVGRNITLTLTFV